MDGRVFADGCSQAHAILASSFSPEYRRREIALVGKLMRIDIKRVTLVLAAFVALLMAGIGIARLVSPDYGQAFVEVMASIYPGYAGDATVG